MDDFVRIRATESALERHHFASLGEAQDQLSPAHFEELMQEITDSSKTYPTSIVQPLPRPSWWGRRRSRP